MYHAGRVFGLNSISSLSLLLQFLLPKTEFECVARATSKICHMIGWAKLCRNIRWILVSDSLLCFFLQMFFLLSHFLNGMTNLHLLLQQCALSKQPYQLNTQRVHCSVSEVQSLFLHSTVAIHPLTIHSIPS